jgi:uncharacterized protein (DUF924 family)
MELQQRILRFWFGERPAELPSAQRLRFWFGGDAATDRAIAAQFAQAVARAAAGDYRHWATTSRGTLALLILLDQFPRNIFRGTPGAYASDGLALALAEAGLAAGQDRSLSPAERAFFYLPLEHSENLAVQQRSVQLFQALRDEAPVEFQPVCTSFLDYAMRHRAIIERFGRFPHRNATLGRTSTAEESAFLDQPGSSF